MKPSSHAWFGIAAAGISVMVLMFAVFPAFSPTKFPDSVALAVPYVPQVFGGNWVDPWDESCEEASLVMVDAFYTKRDRVPTAEAQRKILEMVDWEKRVFRKYQDTTAEETKRLVEEHSSFNATVQRNPSVEEIQKQLAKGRPVIAFLNMYELYQEQNLGDAFHVLVITGYDEASREFILNDPAREAKRYPIDVVMNALHDFDPSTKEPTGPPTVLFTSPGF